MNGSKNKTELIINNIYSFNTLAPIILGERHENMRLLSITSAQEIKEIDVPTLHAQVTPLINNLPVNSKDLIYLIFENADSEKKLYIAKNYIDESSIVELKRTNIIIDIENVDTNDFGIIRDALRELGFEKFRIYRKN